MAARILSAAILGPVVVLLVVYSPPLLFLVCVGAVGTLSLFEYFRMMRSMGLRVHPSFGYAAFWVLLAGLRQKWLPAAAIIAAVVMAGFLSAMWRRHSPRDRAAGLMADLLGVFYLGFLLYPAVPLRFDFGEKLGLHWTILLFTVIWVGDCMALVVGKTMGRTAFARQISPKKTNEGAVGGLFAGVAAAALLQHFWCTDLPLGHVLVVSLLVGAFGQLGDLAESMLKRAAEVKDSSTIIPGHGGILDRIDSLLFAFPVLYIYLLVLYS